MLPALSAPGFNPIRGPNARWRTPRAPAPTQARSHPGPTPPGPGLTRAGLTRARPHPDATPPASSAPPASKESMFTGTGLYALSVGTSGRGVPLLEHDHGLAAKTGAHLAHVGGSRQWLSTGAGRNARVIHRLKARIASSGGNWHAWGMTLRISAECGELLARQVGVIGRSQALEFGLSAYSMRHRARAGEWQRIQRGVYATFSGEATREAQLWAPCSGLGRKRCSAIRPRPSFTVS